MASYIDMDTNAKSLAYTQDSRIGVRPLSVLTARIHALAISEQTLINQILFLLIFRMPPGF